MADVQHSLEESESSSYILFRLGQELFGSPLLSIREVIKTRPLKPVPYMVDYFKGVMNLRGQIVGIIDLRQKFQLLTKDSGEGLILVVETEGGLLGAIIDELVSVQKFEPKDIDQHPAIETKVPMEFFKGVGKLKDRLVNLVDISGCVSSDEMRKVRSAS